MHIFLPPLSFNSQFENNNSSGRSAILLLALENYIIGKMVKLICLVDIESL